MLLPSGYALGIDNTTFAAAVAPLTDRIRLLLAIRMGELVPAQVARQVASLQQIADGRLRINIISSDRPGETLDSAARYRRSTEYMHVIRELLDGRPVALRGEFVDLALDPPRVVGDGAGVSTLLLRRAVVGRSRVRRPPPPTCSSCGPMSPNGWSRCVRRWTSGRPPSGAASTTGGGPT